MVLAKGLPTEALDGHKAAGPQNRFVPRMLSLGNDAQPHIAGRYETIRRTSLASCSHPASAWRRGDEMAFSGEDEFVI